MARSYTQAEMRDRSLFLADMVGATDFAILANVYDLINVHMAMVWGELVQAAPPDHYSSETTIVTTGSAVALPADFLAAIMLFADEGSQRRRPVRQIDAIDRVYYKPADAGLTTYLEYAQTAPKWATDGSAVSQSFDGVLGFEELICARVARDLRIREMTMSPDLQLKIDELNAQVKTMARTRNRGQPRRITDADSFDLISYTYSSNVNAYRIRGSNIELYTSAVVYP